MNLLTRGCVAAVCVLLLPCAAAGAETVLITGSNSGIGLEFARQYAADGWQVIATHRRDEVPQTLKELAAAYDNVRIESLDVADHASIDALSLKLRGVPIDVLLNNAGIVGSFSDPAQQFGTLDYAVLERFVRTNTLGPLKIAEAFYENVRASDGRKIVGISSAAGSIEWASRRAGQSRGLSFRYAYDISKAALNMAYTGLAGEAREDGVIVGLLHPGLVRVARTEQYELTPQMERMMLDVEDSVAQMREVIAALDLAASGSFLAYDGSAVPW